MQSLSALLLCTDDSARLLAEKVLDDYNFKVSFAGSLSYARELIKRNKFDLAFYDADIPGAIDLAGLGTLESFPRVVFVMLRSVSGDVVLGKRIHMLLPKPFTANLLVKTLKAAYGLILNEKRTSLRHIVKISALSTVLIQDQGKRSLKPAKILNVSQSGLCIEADQMLPQGTVLRVEFRIPESNNVIQSVGTVMWAHESGKAGIKFTALSPSHRKALCIWLDSLMPWDPELRPKVAPANTSKEQAVAGGSMKKLLYFDDDPFDLEMCRRALERAGYEVVTADSGLAALHALTSQAIDCAIIDDRMSRLDGSAVARAIKQVRPGVPVCLFTDRSSLSEKDANMIDQVIFNKDGTDALLKWLLGLFQHPPALMLPPQHSQVTDLN
ncbi:MAG TPA: response regulator [Candidatus Angelobacter sp.]